MKKLSSLIVSLLVLIMSKAQSDSISGKKQSIVIASVKTINNSIIRGRVSAINDSQMVLISTNGRQVISPEDMSSLTLKRKNSVLKGALIGLGIGAVTGVIIGFASGNDPVMSYPDPSNDPLGLGTFTAGINNAFAMTAGQKAVASGLALGAGGTLIGAIIGAVAKKKFIIGGRKQTFHDLQGEIMRKLVTK